MRHFCFFKKDSRNPRVGKKFWCWQEKTPCASPFPAGRESVRAWRHYFPLRIWKKDGKHEEDLMLWSYKEICQAQGGFSFPPKCKQNHGKHIEDLMLIQADFPPAASCFSWSMCRSGTRFDVLHHLSAQFALSVTLKTPCWEVLGMGDYYSVVNWALALQPLSAINPFFLTILYVICWLTFEAQHSMNLVGLPSCQLAQVN